MVPAPWVGGEGGVIEMTPSSSALETSDSLFSLIAIIGTIFGGARAGERLLEVEAPGVEVCRHA